MTDQLALCQEQVVLTPLEKALLRSLDTASEIDGRLLSCDLEASHGREHAARAQRATAKNGPQRWLRWWPGRRVLDTVDSCGILSEDTLVSCSIVTGHEGAHSFDLAEHDDHATAEAPYLVDAGRPGRHR